MWCCISEWFSTVRRTVLPQSVGPLVGSQQFEGLCCLRVSDRLSVLDSSKDCAASVSDRLSVLDSLKDCAASECRTARRFSTVQRTVVPQSPGPLVSSRQFKGLWCLGVLDRLSPKIKVLLPSEISRAARKMTPHR